MKILAGLILIVLGAALAAWLGGYVMLYSGINEAIQHVNALSIVKALFFEAGTIPGAILFALGTVLIGDD